MTTTRTSEAVPSEAPKLLRWATAALLSLDACPSLILDLERKISKMEALLIRAHNIAPYDSIIAEDIREVVPIPVPAYLRAKPHARSEACPNHEGPRSYCGCGIPLPGGG